MVSQGYVEGMLRDCANTKVRTMNRHIIPSIVASLVATASAIGFLHVEHKPVVNVVAAPAGPVSPLKAAHIAKTVWPELAQADIDKLTAAVKGTPGRVTIFCVEDSKCGDLALNLDNAFESAHWQSDVVDYSMIQPGIMTGSKSLLAALQSVGLDVKFDDSVRAAHGDAIAIGNRYVP